MPFALAQNTQTEGQSTAHLVTVDAEGNAVSYTTIETTGGVVPALAGA